MICKKFDICSILRSLADRDYDGDGTRYAMAVQKACASCRDFRPASCGIGKALKKVNGGSLE